MKNVFRIFSSIVAIATLTSLVGCGHWSHKTPEQRADWMAEEIGEYLDLDVTQKEKLELLKKEMLDFYSTTRTRHENSRKDIDLVLKNSKLDQNKLLSIVNDHTESIKVAAPKLVEALASFYDSLSVEQQQKLRDKFNAYSNHRRHWYRD